MRKRSQRYGILIAVSRLCLFVGTQYGGRALSTACPGTVPRRQVGLHSFSHVNDRSGNFLWRIASWTASFTFVG